VKDFEYHKPQTIKEAIGLSGSLKNAKYIAGGTDVMVLIKQRKLAPDNLISLRNIKELNHIDFQKELKIGSGVTHSEIVNNEIIKKYYSALVDASGNVGSKQIRNVATIGGNICNAAPSADTACPLLVFDANVMLLGPKSERSVPIDAFLQGPNKIAIEHGEIVKGFSMPAFGEHTGSAYIKHTRRRAMELPILGIAVRATVKTSGSISGCVDAFSSSNDINNIIKKLGDEKLSFEDVRIAMCVVAPKPMRAIKAENALKGKLISEKLLDEIVETAATESRPRDSIRGEAWYRREMVKVLTKRALLRSIARAVGTDFKY